MSTYYEKNKISEKKRSKEWVKNNPEKRKQINKICNKNWAKRNPEKVRINIIKRTVGNIPFSIEDFKKLEKKQRNRCAICEKETKIKLCIDHCHTKLVVRGLLCRECNLGLAHFKDSIYILKKAIKYLSK